MCNRFGTRVCCRLVSLVLFFTSRARRRDACGNVVVSADFDFSRLSVAALRFKMHGRLKVRTTAEQQELKQKERARKLAIYKSLVEKIYTKRKNGELDDEILQLTGQVLVENPDIYTFWNVRKETILVIKNKTNPDELEEFVKKELTLIEQCLRANPKSYHSWFHRRWILQQGTKVDYAHELILCDKCLKLDDRNFHCWDYRRFIVQMSNTPIESELDFSTERIKSNFSNYSSWHYRSELLPRIYPSKDSGTCIDPAKLSEECSLIQNAVFTDPNDQSAWFYQRWLLFSAEDRATDKQKHSLLPILNSELESCQQLHDLEPDNKWVMLQMCDLLRRIDSAGNEAEILQLIDRLCRVDQLRRGFYEDWRSKILAENGAKSCVLTN